MSNATITRFDTCVPQRTTWKTTLTSSRMRTSTPSTSTDWKQVTPLRTWRVSCAMIMTSVVTRISRYYAECLAESKISSRRNFHSKIIRFHCVNIYTSRKKYYSTAKRYRMKEYLLTKNKFMIFAVQYFPKINSAHVHQIISFVVEKMKHQKILLVR